jgi:hypothetical protein
VILEKRILFVVLAIIIMFDLVVRSYQTLLSELQDCPSASCIPENGPELLIKWHKHGS